MSCSCTEKLESLTKRIEELETKKTKKLEIEKSDEVPIQIHIRNALNDLFPLFVFFMIAISSILVIAILDRFYGIRINPEPFFNFIVFGFLAILVIVYILMLFYKIYECIIYLITKIKQTF